MDWIQVVGKAISSLSNIQVNASKSHDVESRTK